MDISVERTYNQALILSLVVPLFDDIVEDGTSLSALDGYVDPDKDLWLIISKGDEILGVVQFTPYNKSMVEIHPFIQKPFRRYSYKAINACLDYIDKYMPENFKSVITNIPSCKRYATLFAHKMGFKEIGRFKNGFVKNRKYHDMVMFQRERKSWVK